MMKRFINDKGEFATQSMEINGCMVSNPTEPLPCSGLHNRKTEDGKDEKERKDGRSGKTEGTERRKETGRSGRSGKTRRSGKTEGTERRKETDRTKDRTDNRQNR